MTARLLAFAGIPSIIKSGFIFDPSQVYCEGINPLFLKAKLFTVKVVVAIVAMI
jgi:hypothetical protein